MVPPLLGQLARLHGALRGASGPALAAHARAAVRYLAEHTGVPALLVAAVLLAVGYRLLRRTARFAVEVAVLAAALSAATHLGWIRW